MPLVERIHEIEWSLNASGSLAGDVTDAEIPHPIRHGSAELGRDRRGAASPHMRDRGGRGQCLVRGNELE